MKKLLLFLVVYGMLSLVVQAKADTVLNFDDIDTRLNLATTDPNYGWNFMPTSPTYGGFNWQPGGLANWEVISNELYQGTTSGLYAQGNTNYPAKSGDNAAYNDNGSLTVAMANNSSFYFKGAWLSPYLQNNGFFSQSSHSVAVTAFSGATQIGPVMTETFTQPGWVWLDPLIFTNGVDLGPITELKFQANAGGTWWLMDDFTYADASSGGEPVVPEPIALVRYLGLLAVGLAAFGWKRRRAR